MSDIVRTFSEQVNRAPTLPKAVDVLHEAVDALGFPRVAYAYMPVPRRSDGKWFSPPVTVRNYPEGWDRGWERHNPNDPYFHACFDSTLSVDWNRVQKRDSLNGGERDSWNYLADRGLSQGVTMPIHLPMGRFAYVSALHDCSEADWEVLVARSRRTLFLIAHEFQDIITRRFEGPNRINASIHLSPRELECLQWAAHGKTAEDTACILDRSVETVRLHLKHATTKLGALNRAHAVAKAMAFGLINMN
jgi:DNA-binding CsgD family transcriptional regulator